MSEEARLCRMIIEMPDGMVIEGMVLSADIAINQDMRHMMEIGQHQMLGGGSIYSSMPKTWRATLMGDGTTLRYIQPDAVKAVFDERQTAVEWKCDYCGAVMLREDTECRGCGATRPFLYDR